MTRHGVVPTRACWQFGQILSVRPEKWSQNPPLGHTGPIGLTWGGTNICVSAASAPPQKQSVLVANDNAIALAA